MKSAISTIILSLFAMPTYATLNEYSAVPKDISKYCHDSLAALAGPFEKTMLTPVCEQAKVMDGCWSKKGEAIFHYDKIGAKGEGSKRVLAISIIHGDEPTSGSVSRAWMTRLEKIDPRNTWRVIPIANPDGLKLKTRTNAGKVDINRNFPSKDWDEKAVRYWQTDRKGDPRRNPGPSAASEVETQCLMKQIEDFKPDFIISIHTPLGVLDFDGPQIANPGFKPLPWVSLGNYPGSLGRYMWVDRSVPVLTIELRGSNGLKKLEDFDQLQDITGTVAIQADKLRQKEPVSPALVKAGNDKPSAAE